MDKLNSAAQPVRDISGKSRVTLAGGFVSPASEPSNPQLRTYFERVDTFEKAQQPFVEAINQVQEQLEWVQASGGGVEAELLQSRLEALRRYNLDVNIKRYREALQQAGPLMRNHRLDPQDSHLAHKWPRNMQVFAPNLQDMGASPIQGSKGYINDLTQELNKPEVHSLSDASARMEQQTQTTNDIFKLPHFSISSPVTPKGWNKDETPPRKVLIIMGDERQEHQVAQTIQMARDVYRVAPENIQVLRNPNAASLEKAFQEMQRFQRRHRNEKPEAMVVALSHGGFQGKEKGLSADDLRQGSNAGRLYLNFHSGRKQDEYVWTEEDFKRKARKYLAEYEAVAGIVYACYAGSFIS